MIFTIKQLPVRTMPYSNTIFEDIHVRSFACPVCGLESNATEYNYDQERNIEILKESKPKGFPDYLYSVDENIFSKRFFKCLEEERLGSYPTFKRTIVSPLPKPLEMKDAPQYYALDGLSIRGAELEETNFPYFFDDVKCKYCGQSQFKYVYPFAIENATLFPFVLKKGSWNGSFLFTAKGLSSKILFCTEEVVDCVQRHGLTNFLFIPIELGRSFEFNYDYTKENWRHGLQKAIDKCKNNEEYKYQADDPIVTAAKQINPKYQAVCNALRSHKEPIRKVAEANRAKLNEILNENQPAPQWQEGSIPGDSMTIPFGETELKFRWAPTGKFTMGSPKREYYRFPDEIQHKVKLTRGFWILESLVTQAMWNEVMQENPSVWKHNEHPVESLTWYDCQAFIKAIQPLAPQGASFALPTEAQWEYACRAGTSGPFFGHENSKDYAWHSSYCLLEKDDVYHSMPVCKKKPNDWGLYDMLGNVDQWCQDFYAPYPEGSVVDPKGPETGTDRVFRGGSYYVSAAFGRAATRNCIKPELVFKNRGFRIICQKNAEQ